MKQNIFFCSRTNQNFAQIRFIEFMYDLRLKATSDADYDLNFNSLIFRMVLR